MLSEEKVNFFQKSSKSLQNDYVFPIVDDKMEVELKNIFAVVQPVKVHRGHTFPFEIKN